MIIICKIFCFLFGHNFVFVFQRGNNYYYECGCDERKVEHLGMETTPLDISWLNDKK